MSAQEFAPVRLVRVRLTIEGKAVVIEKGKGGKRRVLDFSDSPEKLEQLEDLLVRFKELAKGVNCRNIHGPSDQTHVKAACRSLKDDYVGAQGSEECIFRNWIKSLKRREYRRRRGN